MRSGPCALVGQHDVRALVEADGLLGFGADAHQRFAQRGAGIFARRRRREGAVDARDIVAQLAHHARVHAVGEDRAREHVDARLRFVLRQDVAEVLEARGQASSPGLRAAGRSAGW